MVLHIIDLALPEDESLILDGPLLEGYPPGQILDILHDEVHRNTIISKPWNNDIRIDCCRENEVTVCLLHEFVVLRQDSYDRPTSLCCITLQPPAKSQVICISSELPSQLMKIL